MAKEEKKDKDCTRCGGTGVTMVETRLGPRLGKCPACR